MPKSLSITRKNTKGHAAVLYENPHERIQLLADYLREGLSRDELCILVTPEPLKEILDQLQTLDLDAHTAYDDGSLRIFDMQDTYLKGGDFVADYMLKNVETFLQDAREAGFTGLRTAGEMSWLHGALHAQPEAEHYESEVNKITHEHDDFLGLCLYPASNSFGADILRGVLNTHPKYVYDGQLYASPHYA